MYKLLTLAIALAAYATLSAFADQSLQKMGFVVTNMNSTNVNNITCVPKVWNDTVYTYISFTCDIGSQDAQTTYNGMVAYMANGVGNATSSYTTQGSTIVLLYKGDYDPNLKPGGPLSSLGAVLTKYANPLLGSYNCTQIVKQSKGGLTYIGINVPLNGTESTGFAACDDVWNYLRGQGYLDSTLKLYSLFTDAVNGNHCFLELWPYINYQY